MTSGQVNIFSNPDFINICLHMFTQILPGEKHKSLFDWLQFTSTLNLFWVMRLSWKNNLVFQKKLLPQSNNIEIDQ